LLISSAGLEKYSHRSTGVFVCTLVHTYAHLQGLSLLHRITHEKFASCVFTKSNFHVAASLSKGLAPVLVIGWGLTQVLRDGSFSLNVIGPGRRQLINRLNNALIPLIERRKENQHTCRVKTIFKKSPLAGIDPLLKFFAGFEYRETFLLHFYFSTGLGIPAGIRIVFLY